MPQQMDRGLQDNTPYTEEQAAERAQLKADLKQEDKDYGTARATETSTFQRETVIGVVTSQSGDAPTPRLMSASAPAEPEKPADEPAAKPRAKASSDSK